jgi:hypothetical protein
MRVAEVFLIAWRRLDDVPFGNEARPWLFATARRVLANQGRANARRRRLSEKLSVQPFRLTEMDPPEAPLVDRDTQGHNTPFAAAPTDTHAGLLAISNHCGLSVRTWLAERGRIGAGSQRTVRLALTKLSGRGWMVRNGVPWPGGDDDDHLLRSPTGLGFAIETKTRTFSEQHLRRTAATARWAARRRRRYPLGLSRFCAWCAHVGSIGVTTT